MNIALLQEIKQSILDNPKQLEMRIWFHTSPEVPNCGTACCIAGWAVCLARREKPVKMASLYRSLELNITTESRKVLDITYEQGHRLFHTSNWPHRFGDNFDSLPPIERASVAAARIDHFIATEGRE